MAHQAQVPPGDGAPPVDRPAPAPTTAGSDHHPEIDWARAAESPEFKELIQRRRSFVLPSLAFVFVWYFGFIALAGYAPDFMGERLIDGFTVGYAIALSQFVMTWVLGWLYLRQSDRVFDPLARRAAERALERQRETRFDPATRQAPATGRAPTGAGTPPEGPATTGRTEVSR